MLILHNYLFNYPQQVSRWCFVCVSGKGIEKERESTEKCGGNKAFHTYCSAEVCFTIECENSRIGVQIVYKDIACGVESESEDTSNFVLKVLRYL